MKKQEKNKIDLTAADIDEAMNRMECWKVDLHLKKCNKHKLQQRKDIVKEIRKMKNNTHVKELNVFNSFTHYDQAIDDVISLIKKYEKNT